MRLLRRACAAAVRVCSVALWRVARSRERNNMRVGLFAGVSKRETQHQHLLSVTGWRSWNQHREGFLRGGYRRLPVGLERVVALPSPLAPYAVSSSRVLGAIRPMSQQMLTNSPETEITRPIWPL